MYINTCFIFSIAWYYVVSYFVSCSSLFLQPVFPNTSTTSPAFFWMSFAWNTFSISLLSVCVCPRLKWVSCGQHIYRSDFCVNSPSLCLLVEALNPFTFKVTISIYVLIAILLIVWGVFFGFFFWLCFFPSCFVFLSCDLTAIFSVLFVLLTVCVSCRILVCFCHEDLI